MGSVKKTDLADRVYQKFGGLKGDSLRYVNEFFNTIKELVDKGEDVKLHRFGNFVVRDKKARRGRNPATGDSLILDARRVVKFKPSKKLKDAIKVALGNKE